MGLFRKPIFAPKPGGGFRVCLRGFSVYCCIFHVHIRAIFALIYAFRGVGTEVFEAGSVVPVYMLVVGTHDDFPIGVHKILLQVYTGDGWV